MSKVLLLAYTNLNFGDDMFVKTICQAFPEQSFEIEAPDEYRAVFAAEKNLTVIKPSFGKKLIRKINRYLVDRDRHGLQFLLLRKYKAVVFVIGALFDENELWHDGVNSHGIEWMKNQLFNYSYHERLPFLLLGCNMTRVVSAEYLAQMEYIFKGLKDVCFRDRYSYEFFKQLGNVRYAPDIVFNYHCNTAARKNKVILSVWGVLLVLDRFPQWKWAESLWEPYCEFLIQVANYLIREGEEVYLLSLCENEGDLKACESVYANVQKKDKAHIINYNGNIDEIISLFEETKFAVCTRFHSIVMAVNAGCSFFPVVYESKSMKLLQDIQYSGSYGDIKQTNLYKLEAVVDAYRKECTVENASVKSEARKQFDVLSSILS